MSRKKLLMKTKIHQAVKAGHEAEVVMPKGMKNKKLLKLFEKKP